MNFKIETVCWAAWIAFAVVGGVACDLPGLRPVVPSDVGSSADADATRCQFGASRCLGTGRLVCASDGEPEYRECGEGEVCESGRCRAIANECDTSLPFRLSDSTLQFDTDGRLRPDSQSLRIENCSGAPLEVSAVDLAGARSPSGEPVFTVDNRPPVEGRTLPPGTSARLKFRYEPAFGFFLGDTRTELQLTLRADRPFRTDVRFQKRVDCLGASPMVDFEEVAVGSARRHGLDLYNCGNQGAVIEVDEEFPREKAGVRIRAADSAPDEVTVGPGESAELPLVFEFGDRPRVVWEPFEFDALRGGPTTSVRPQRVGTAVRARIRRPGCEERSPPRAAFRRRPPNFDDDPEQDPYSTGTRLEVPPHRSIWLRRRHREIPGTSTERGERLVYWLADRPPSSDAELARESRTELYRRFRPDVVGTYRIGIRRFGADGVPGCPEADGTLTVEVTPDSGLYAELSWGSDDDPIPDDRGYGRGADLNLHLLETGNPPETADGWNDSDRDCFQRGTRGTRRCPEGTSFRGATVSGRGAEAVAVERLEGDRFCVAVHAWNPYRFSQTAARLRVYHRGRLVDGLPVSRRIGGGVGTVWFAGCWDDSTETFEMVDSIKKSF